MPKPRSEIDSNKRKNYKDKGLTDIRIWIHPDHKEEARRKEHEEWRAPIETKDKIN
jgi:hypothetical protein